MGRIKGSKNKKAEVSEVQAETPAATEKDTKIKKVVSELHKTFGYEAIKYASDEPKKDKIPFGVEPLDNMLGGGIPLGMFTVLWGAKSSGKTTLAYKAVGQAQKKGKRCLFVDLENSFSPEWAEKCGVDLTTLLLAHFSVAEEAMDAIIKLAKEKAVDFIVLDSIQSLSPKGEQETKTGKEKSVEDDTMALLPRKLSQFFRMCADGVYSGQVGMLLIGQARVDLGSFIKLEKLSGGNALAHWASLIMKVYRGTKADAPRYKFKVNGKTKEIIIGFNFCAKLEKTKIHGTAPENTELRMPFHSEYCFDRPTDEQIEKVYGEWIAFESDVEGEE